MRILVPESGVPAEFTGVILKAGYEVVFGSAEAEGFIPLAQSVLPEIVVIPADHGEAAAMTARLTQGGVAPVVWVVGRESVDMVNRAKQAGAAGMVRSTAQPFDVQVAFELAATSFRLGRELRRSVARLEDALETRKLVERAKGTLMDRYGLGESEAYERMRRLAMNARRPLKHIAQMILNDRAAPLLADKKANSTGGKKGIVSPKPNTCY